MHEDYLHVIWRPKQIRLERIWHLPVKVSGRIARHESMPNHNREHLTRRLSRYIAADRRQAFLIALLLQQVFQSLLLSSIRRLSG